jgi:CPA1 family monovalent cation:H+ antiporter
MVAVGYEDGALLLPTVFLVIIVTVLVHGLTLAPLARRLGLARDDGNGVLIVGASPFTEQVAEALHRLDINVKVADGSYQRLQPLRMASVPVYFGEVLSEDAEERLDAGNLTYLLCATDNDYYNALVSRSLGQEFGYHRTFQLATHQEAASEGRRLTVQRRGSFAFDGELDYFALHSKLAEGWVVHTTKLSEEFGHEQLFARLGTLGDDWVMLGAASASGGFRLFGKDHRFTPSAGSTVLYFAPAKAKRALADE